MRLTPLRPSAKSLSGVLPTTMRVGCKINLGLRITGIRENGYHELDSLFLPLAQPWDELDFVPGKVTEAGITLECDTEGIDLTHNTVTKAYETYAARTGFAPALHIRLRKGIPHGAGLGGGSADAAAMLHWCNTHASQALPLEELQEVALRVGADVPFFLHNVPAKVRGIGEQVTPCPSPWQGWHLVLLCPKVPVSTPWAYAAWDKAHDEKKKCQFCECALTSNGVEAKEKSSCATWLFNDFETVVFSTYPELRKLKERLLQEGATAAVMSGSGASMVGLFREHEKAQQAAQVLGKKTQVFVSVL